MNMHFFLWNPVSLTKLYWKICFWPDSIMCVYMYILCFFSMPHNEALIWKMWLNLRNGWSSQHLLHSNVRVLGKSLLAALEGSPQNIVKLICWHIQLIMHQSFVTAAPMGMGNCGVFNFARCRTPVNALHCRAISVVKALPKSHAQIRLR